MKKLRKILLITVGTIVGLLLLLVVGFKLFFPVDKAKDFALDKATELLGREVSIESVNLSFRGGLGLRLGDVQVGNPHGFTGDPFLTTDNVDFKVAIGPLLKGQVRGHSLIINRPVIRLRKLADGSDNFTFTPVVDVAPSGPAADAQGPAPVSASIDRIEINNGQLAFQDEMAGAGARLHGLELRSSLANPAVNLLRAVGTAKADSLLVAGEQAVPLLIPRVEFNIVYDQTSGATTIENLDLDVNSIALKLTGSSSGKGDDLVAKAHLSAEKITIQQLLAFAPPEALEQMQGAKASGAIALACDLDFLAQRPEPLGYAGTLTVTGLVLEQKDIAATVEVKNAEAAFGPDRLQLRILQATAGGEPWTGQVEILDFLEPRIRGQLAGVIDLALAQPFLEPELAAELAGRSTFEVDFAGPVDDPDQLEVSGLLAISGVRFSAATLPEPITDLSAEVAFDRTRITVNELEASTPSSAFALTGTLTDPFPYFLPPELRDSTIVAPNPSVEFTMQSRRLDIDRLFPQASPGTETATAAAEGDSVILVEFPDITGHGTVAIDTLIYSNVEFTAITARVEINDRKIDCIDAKAQVYTGGVSGTTSIDLNDPLKPRYAGSFSAKQIEAQDFLTRFTKFGGLFYGKFDLDGDFSAAGLDPLDIQKSLTLDSLAGMNSGKVVTSGFAYSALSNLAGKAGQTLQKEQGLKNLSTAIKAEDGKVILEQLRTGLGSLGDLSLGGSYGIDGAVDFQGTLLLSKDQTSKLLESGGLVGKMAGLLGGKGVDRISLPLTVGGSLKSPRMKVDYSVLTREAKENLQEDLKEDLGKKLKGLFK